ncbi:unnamed protein product, partial [Gulo gulo]
SIFKSSFLIPYLCLQHFHNYFLPLNSKSTLDPVMDTFCNHGSTMGLDDLFFGFRQSHKNFGSQGTNPLKLTWAHATGAFCYKGKQF